MTTEGASIHRNPILMLEQALNAFWILLGLATVAAAWSLGVVGPTGPDSGFFPLIAALIILAAGFVLFLRPGARATAPDLPRGPALGRIAGVIAGLAVMAVGMPYLGFAATGALTMLILLRTVERTNWLGAVALAVTSSAFVVWLFGHALGMVLPRGPWGW
jgi:putative tricarboxylic transport membrane protein